MQGFFPKDKNLNLAFYIIDSLRPILTHYEPCREENPELLLPTEATNGRN
jgi:hypothetical protein